MQNQYPLLIIAQSGRFIAQSAIRAGYTVRVADCFGDQDLLAHTETFLHLPPVNEWSATLIRSTIETLSQDSPCELIIGTGLEYCSDAISDLPPHVHFLGNSLPTISQLRDAPRLFEILEQYGLPFPQSIFTKPKDATGYLKKNMHSCGGQAVTTEMDAHPKDGDYYQQYVEGCSASATFIANGETAELLAINQQHHDEHFGLVGMSQPASVTQHVQQSLQDIVQTLTQVTELRGFNSLDVIIDDEDKVFVLEVNPRISASVELLCLDNMLLAHKQACDGQPLPECALPNDTRELRTLFAHQNVKARQAAIWPDVCHDIPPSSHLIEKGQPICTIVVRDSSIEQLKKKASDAEQLVFKNCLSDA